MTREELEAVATVVANLDEETALAILATFKRFKDVMDCGGVVDQTTLDRWFDEELARVHWPYQH